MGKQVKELLEQKNPPGHIIFNLTNIQGFDISSVNTFQRIAQQALAKGITLSFAAAPERLLDLFKSNAAPEVMARVNIHKDLDHALESAKNHVC